MVGARMVAMGPKEPALTRACKVWQCRAGVYTRGVVRQEGYHGPLPTLDEIASGRRGTAAPKGMAMWARELYALGASREEVADRLAETARLIAHAVHDTPHDAA